MTPAVVSPNVMIPAVVSPTLIRPAAVSPAVTVFCCIQSETL